MLYGYLYGVCLVKEVFVVLDWCWLVEYLVIVLLWWFGGKILKSSMLFDLFCCGFCLDRLFVNLFFVVVLCDLLLLVCLYMYWACGMSDRMCNWMLIVFVDFVLLFMMMCGMFLFFLFVFCCVFFVGWYFGNLLIICFVFVCFMKCCVCMVLEWGCNEMYVV